MNLKEHPNIHFIGFVEPGDKFNLYCYAKVFVYPSFYEGFGLPVLESMEAGVPVITSKDSAMSEIADGAALLVDPNDPESISKALNDLLSDESFYSLVQVKGNLQRVKFSWKKAAEQFLILFKTFKKPRQQ